MFALCVSIIHDATDSDLFCSLLMTFMSTGVALRSSHLDTRLCTVIGPEGVSWRLPLVDVPMAEALL